MTRICTNANLQRMSIDLNRGAIEFRLECVIGFVSCFLTVARTAPSQNACIAESGDGANIMCTVVFRMRSSII